MYYLNMVAWVDNIKRYNDDRSTTINALKKQRWMNTYTDWIDTFKYSVHLERNGWITRPKRYPSNCIHTSIHPQTSNGRASDYTQLYWYASSVVIISLFCWNLNEGALAKISNSITNILYISLFIYITFNNSNLNQLFFSTYFNLRLFRSIQFWPFYDNSQDGF
jgi:hypothetical protein